MIIEHITLVRARVEAVKLLERELLAERQSLKAAQGICDHLYPNGTSAACLVADLDGNRRCVICGGETEILPHAQ